MKIVVAPADAHGCGFIRMIVPYMELRKRGHDVAFIDDTRDPRLHQADVIVLQRQTSEHVLTLTRNLKQRGAKIVFEFDDNFHCIPSTNPNHVHYSNGKPGTKMLETFIREADVVTVSTLGLVDEYAKFSANLKVCYNALPDEQFHRFAPDLSGKPKVEGQIRIGWAGSDTHRGDFLSVLKPIVRVMETVPWTRMVFVGADMRVLLPPHLRGRSEFAGMTFGNARFRVGDENREIGPIQYYDLVNNARLDVAIAPLESTTFNRCKSWIKVLEYGMLGIPSLASNFGPYRHYANDYGSILTSDPKHWENQLRLLCINQERRAELALANRESVERHHLMSRNVEQWEAAFAPLLATVAA